MARPEGTPRLTPEIIEALKRKGFNQTEIAEQFGVSRQYVSEVKHQVTGFSMTARERAARIFPYRVGSEFQGCSPYKRLRDHAEYMFTSGNGMSDDKKRRLVSFYRRLEREHLVVEYDPTLLPSLGISTGGWRYTQRQVLDNDLIVRLNEYSCLGDEDRTLWRIPKTLPRFD
jgi:transcriptional regulator with XRE-family HTH domain